MFCLEYFFNFEHFSGEVRYILLGELVTNESNDGSEPKQFNVIDRIIHPNYKKTLKYHDIALLKINGPVRFSDYIRPICLPDLGK